MFPRRKHTLQEKSGSQAPFLFPLPLMDMGHLALLPMVVAEGASVPWPGRFPSAGAVPVPVGRSSQAAALPLMAAWGRTWQCPLGDFCMA